LRDAISFALVARPYAAARAAEKAGELKSLRRPRHIAEACERYGVAPEKLSAALDGAPYRLAPWRPPRLMLDPVGLMASPAVLTVMLAEDDSERSGVPLCAFEIDRYPPAIARKGSRVLKAEYDRLRQTVVARLLERPEPMDGRYVGWFSREQVRALAKASRIDLGAYAAWVADFDDGSNEDQAVLDRELPGAALWVIDLRASRAQIDRGRLAAEALLGGRGVSVAQAYVASVLRSRGGRFVQGHLAAWEDAKRAALEGAVTESDGAMALER
jgi:hypothetical protein